MPARVVGLVYLESIPNSPGRCGIETGDLRGAAQDPWGCKKGRAHTQNSSKHITTELGDMIRKHT